MRLVSDAVVPPARCAFVPFIGGSNDPVGFFWNGNSTYVSFTAFKKMADIAGWVPAKADADVGELGARDARIAELEAELAREREKTAAVEVLKLNGAVSARKPGRPKKEVAA